MFNSTNSIWSRLCSAVSFWAGRAVEELLAGDDAVARRQGWEITRTTGGLGRSYRDPRFNGLVECPACLGTGQARYVNDERCWPCQGQGRQRVSSPAGFRSRW